MKKQRSEEYINSFLKSSREYPLVNDSQRKTLITRDLFQVQRAFEDGYDQGKTDFLEAASEWILNNAPDYVISDHSGVYYDRSKLYKDFNDAMTNGKV